MLESHWEACSPVIFPHSWSIHAPLQQHVYFWRPHSQICHFPLTSATMGTSPLWRDMLGLYVAHVCGPAHLLSVGDKLHDIWWAAVNFNKGPGSNPWCVLIEGRDECQGQHNLEIMFLTKLFPQRWRIYGKRFSQWLEFSRTNQQCSSVGTQCTNWSWWLETWKETKGWCWQMVLRMVCAMWVEVITSK